MPSDVLRLVAPELAWADADGECLFGPPDTLWAQRQAWQPSLAVRVLDRLWALIVRLAALVGIK